MHGREAGRMEEDWRERKWKRGRTFQCSDGRKPRQNSPQIASSRTAGMPSDEASSRMSASSFPCASSAAPLPRVPWPKSRSST